MRADRVLTNGLIWTGSAEVEAVAITGDRVAAVGSADEVLAAAGADVERIDLGGRRVIPGLIDSHVHFLRAGIHWNDLVRWDDVDTLEAGLARIARRASETPEGTWIRVLGGWHPQRFAEGRGPTPAELDAAAPDHPVYVQLLYEEAVLNRRAVDASPAEEAVVRGPAAFAAVLGSVPVPDPAVQADSYRALMAEGARLGLTGVIDPGGFGVTPDSYSVLDDLWRSGALSLRVRLYHVPWRRGEEVGDVAYWIEHVEPGAGDQWLRHVGLGEIFTFGCHDMEGVAPFAVGEQARGELLEITRMLAAAGWPGHVHAILDSTVDAVLDVWEQVASEAGGLPRFSLAHSEFIGARNLDRAASLGIGIAVQDRLLYRSADSIAVWGPAVVAAAPPLRGIVERGIPLGAGTDGTVVTSMDPWHALWWLVTGGTHDGAPPRDERHRLSRHEALAAYTTGSAWFSLDEDERGRLEPGMLADLAVLTDDFFGVADDDIPSIRSLLTMVGGRIVHAEGAFSRAAG